jgi:hypothetical protein
MKIKFLTGVLLCSLAFNVTSCITEDEAEDLEEQITDDTDNGDNRNAFIGTWSVNETSKLIGSRTYTVTVEKDTEFPQRVNMYNFYALGTDSIVANVSSVYTNTITIPFQTLLGNYIGGTGTLANNKISFDYTVDDGNAIDTVKAVYSK